MVISPNEPNSARKFDTEDDRTAPVAFENIGREGETFPISGECPHESRRFRDDRGERPDGLDGRY